MKENKNIHCARCYGEISNKSELVVTNYFLSIVPYHERCFTKELKEVSTIFVGNSPINGTMWNIGAVLAVIVGVILLFIQELRYISTFSLLILCIRLYSWFKYERIYNKL